MLKKGGIGLRGATRRRQAERTVLGLCALFLAGGTTQALAQSSDCSVSLALDNVTTLRALQVEVHYAGVPGGFIEPNGCTFGPAGSFEVDVEQAGEFLEFAYADLVGFTGPVAIGTCTFRVTSPMHTLVAGDFSVDVVDHSGVNPPEPADPAPVVSLSVGACVPAVAACGNGVLEAGEECDGTAGCGTNCKPTGSCAEVPLDDCKVTPAGAAKLLVKNDTKNPTSNAKDSAQFQWKKGAATDVSEFLDPVGGMGTYSLCIYDAGTLVFGADVPAGGTCAGKPCWKATGTTGFGFKGDVADNGVSQIKMKAGDAGKAQVQVKAKSKLANFTAPALPMAEPVLAQFVADNGMSSTCFEAEFTGATKNEEKLYNAKN